MDSKDLAREALGGLRRAEVGRLNCAPCLVARLSPAFPPTAVQAAVAQAFEHPGALRVKPGPCEACKKPRLCMRLTRDLTRRLGI